MPNQHEFDITSSDVFEIVETLSSLLSHLPFSCLPFQVAGIDSPAITTWH